MTMWNHNLVANDKESPFADHLGYAVLNCGSTGGSVIRPYLSGALYFDRKKATSIILRCRLLPSCCSLRAPRFPLLLPC